MRYDKFRYLYPPRAENAIPAALLNSYERRKWVAQIKKNGTNSVIFVSPEKKVFAMNRHNADHKQWQFTPESEAIFKNLPGKGWYVINAELLHSKVRNLRDTNYIHDILVDDGEYLLGETYAQRYSRLQMRFLHPAAKGSKYYWILDEHTWLAKNVTESFYALYQSLTDPEDEGLVLKDPCGKLTIRDNRGWTVKCRYPHKNFSF